MSRALRRHPLVSKPPAKGPQFRPGGARPVKKEAASVAAAESGKKRSLLSRFVPRDIFAELKKVTWPTREETVRLTAVVLDVSITIGLLLGGVDLGFNWLVDNTLLRQ